MRPKSSCQKKSDQNCRIGFKCISCHTFGVIAFTSALRDPKSGCVARKTIFHCFSLCRSIHQKRVPERRRGFNPLFSYMIQSNEERGMHTPMGKGVYHRKSLSALSFDNSRCVDEASQTTRKLQRTKWPDNRVVKRRKS